MTSISSPAGGSLKKKTKPLPVIDRRQILGRSPSSRLKSTSGPVAAQTSGVSGKEVPTKEKKTNQESLVKETRPAEQISSAASLASARKAALVSCDRSGSSPSCKEASQLHEVSSSSVSRDCSAKAKRYGDSEDDSDSTTDAKAKREGQINKGPPVHAECGQGPVSTPISRHRFRDIPDSTDSSQDDMTLAEMKSLVNRFDRQEQRVPGEKHPLPPTNRSLSMALDAISSNAENVDPRRDSNDGGVSTVADGIVSSTLNRCRRLSPTPSECSR